MYMYVDTYRYMYTCAFWIRSATQAVTRVRMYVYMYA